MLQFPIHLILPYCNTSFLNGSVSFTVILFRRMVEPCGCMSGFAPLSRRTPRVQDELPNTSLKKQYLCQMFCHYLTDLTHISFCQVKIIRVGITRNVQMWPEKDFFSLLTSSPDWLHPWNIFSMAFPVCHQVLAWNPSESNFRSLEMRGRHFCKHKGRDVSFDKLSLLLQPLMLQPSQLWRDFL